MGLIMHSWVFLLTISITWATNADSNLCVGVPIKRMVAGVAMGLIMEENGQFQVLTDILGSEDALGDMDFKVSGDAEGVTAFQMDIKVRSALVVHHQRWTLCRSLCCASPTLITVQKPLLCIVNSGCCSEVCAVHHQRWSLCRGLCCASPTLVTVLSSLLSNSGGHSK